MTWFGMFGTCSCFRFLQQNLFVLRKSVYSTFIIKVRSQLKHQESACSKLQQELDYTKQQQQQQAATKDSQNTELQDQLNKVWLLNNYWL